jgi:uncharacterized protein YhjY with autotransporter beta-barrel domain
MRRPRSNVHAVILAAFSASVGVATAQELVPNNNPSGAGSLAQAISTANSSPGSTITLTISGETIDQNVALPTVTVPVTIDGGSGNTLQGIGINPVLNVSGAATFNYNDLALIGSVGTAALGTSADGTSGTAGTAGGTGANGGNAAAGSVGIQLTNVPDLTLDSTITGGAGGSANGGSANGGSSSGAGQNGGHGGTGGNGGFGGAGGTGVVISGNNVVVTNNGTITGGAGGAADGGSANGGSATGTGANGGNGGTGGNGGISGNGGAGLVATGSSFTLINTGTISHGAPGSANGGTANGGNSASGTGGSGGTTGTAGILGSGGGAVMVQTDGATIIDSGTISGSDAGDAIQFTGTNNTIELEAGYSIVGNVYANQSGNLLELGGSGNASLDVTRLNQQGANQFLNIVNFVKTGTSTWTLLNTTFRPTTWYIEQGTLEVASDGALGTSGSVVLLGGGELLTDQTGGFSTNRTVNLQGNGTIAAVLGTNPNYYGPITIQTSGTDTLTVGDAVNNASIAFRSTVSNGAGTLSVDVINGTLSMDGNNSYSGGTTISGANTLVIANTTTGLGSGTLTMTGGTLYADSSSLNIGALNGTGGSITSSSNATLSINDNLGPAQTFSGTIRDADATINVSKSGSGTEIFAGANTYSGGTTLTSGTLGAGSPTAFGTGNFTNSGGTLELADGNHTLNLGALFTQNSGTTLLSLVNDASSDQITAGGNGHLGGNLTVNLGALSQPGTRAGTIPFTLITTTGLNNTTYATTTFQNAPSGSNPVVSYTADDVVLNVTTSAVLFPTTSLNGNEQGLLGAINQNLLSGNASASFTTVDSALASLYANNPGALGSALDQLSPQAFGQFTESTAFNNASFAIAALDDYLASQRTGPDGTFAAGHGTIDSSGLIVNDPSYDPTLGVIHSKLLAWNPAPSHGVISDVAAPLLGGIEMKDETNPNSLAPPASSRPWNVYVRGNVVLAHGSAEQNVGHFDDNSESVVLGADYRLTPHLLVGLTAGYAHTDASLDDAGSSATVDSYSPGIYASYADRGWYADFAGNYIRNAYTQDRVISVLGQTASSAPAGNEGVVSLDGGYDFHRGALTFGPLAGLQYTHLTVNSYQESGSAADLSVNEQQQDSLRSRLGGRVSYAFSDAGIVFTPHLDASWQHEFLDPSRGITSQFGFGGGSFVVQTNQPSRDSALVDLGLDADLNRTVMLFADYELQAGQSNYFGQSVDTGVRIGF